MPLTTSAELSEAIRTAEIVFVRKTGQAIASGAWGSLFKSSGMPVGATNQTAAAICDHNLQGSLIYQQPVAGKKLYLAAADYLISLAGTSVQLHDRIGHQGGLVANITTLQTTNLPLDISGTGSNLVERRGRSDYRDVQWWLEVITATGATPQNLTINYTAHDDTTSSIVLPYPASPGAQRIIPFYTADGKGIKSVQSVQFAGSTGTAGNFGIVATRRVVTLRPNNYTQFEIAGPFLTQLAQIPAQSCLVFHATNTGTSSGGVHAKLTIAQA